MSLRWLSIVVITMSLALVTSAATAQSLEEEQATAEEEEAPPAGEEGASTELSDEQAEVEDDTPREVARDSTDPHEEENVDYFFLGAFYRHVVIPAGIQDLFVAGGIDASNPGVGATFNYRKNNFNIIFNVWWNNAVGEGFFRAEGDPDTDMEFIDVDLGVVFLNAEFLWAFPITDWFAVELGFDLGFGFIYGDLVRSEAYQSSDGSWHECSGPGDPNDTSGRNFCEAPVAPDPCYNSNGAHYDCREANWTAEGGDVPVIFPWLALPHFALRFKPIHQIQIRLDVSYNLYAVSFGGGISYGF